MAGSERIDTSGRRLFIARTATITLFVLLGLAAIVARMMWLQIDNHTHFATLSAENRIKLLPLPPLRGSIYDRNGRVLAKNVPSVDLLIIPDQVKQLDETIASLSELLPISKEELERFNQQKKRTRRFEKIAIKTDLSDSEMAHFAVERHRFPGVELGVTQRRFYPYAELTGHVVGYIGRINEREMEVIDQADYAGTTHIGKTGLEKYYEEELHGTVGFKKVEINAAGQIIRTLETTHPIRGKDLHLFFDVELQLTAFDALGEHNGSVVAIDTQTGGTLALVSKPSFDPNLFVNGISHKNYSMLRDDPQRPLFNRAINGSYPPGSTVKPFIGLAGLETGTITEKQSIVCPGIYKIKGTRRTFRDWKRGGHGVVALDKAITQSCDIYYYDLAYSMGIELFHNYMSKFFFGRRTGIDMPGETTAVLPSREWKERRFKQIWLPGDTVNIGIGQGYFQVSPVQLAYATMLLANDGEIVPPRLVARVGGTYTFADHSPVEHISKVDPHHWHVVIEGMRHVVEGVGGTARRIKNDYYSVAGKTGTAQVVTIAQDEEYDEKNLSKEKHDHALFISFAPIEEPRVAIAVIAENGGHGGSTAAPVAKAVLDAWLVDEPLPVITETSVERQDAVMQTVEQ